MEFRVYRNSGRTPPCEEAEKKEIAITETVHCRTPEEYDSKKKKYMYPWLSVGKNHRTNKNGYICRDMETIERWFVRISSIKDLMEFSKKYGNVTVGFEFSNVFNKYSKKFIGGCNHKTPFIKINDAEIGSSWKYPVRDFE